MDLARDRPLVELAALTILPPAEDRAFVEFVRVNLMSRPEEAEREWSRKRTRCFRCLRATGLLERDVRHEIARFFYAVRDEVGRHGGDLHALLGIDPAHEEVALEDQQARASRR